MGSYRQALLYDLATFVTFLARETRVHSNHLMTSSRSLLFKDGKECTPTGVHDGLRKVMVLDHVADTQVFYRDMVMGLSILLRYFEMEITPLPSNLEMRLSGIPGSLASALTACL